MTVLKLHVLVHYHLFLIYQNKCVDACILAAKIYLIISLKSCSQFENFIHEIIELKNEHSIFKSLFRSVNNYLLDRTYNFLLKDS